MKLPGPDHPITLERHGRRVRVHFADAVIADTTRALTLCEAGYAPKKPDRSVQFGAFEEFGAVG